MTRALSLLAASLLFAFPLPAQEATSTTVRAAVETKDVVVTHYSPKEFTIDELLVAAKQLFGESLAVRDPQGATDRNRDGYALLPHFVVLGEMLLVRDTGEQAKQILATLGRLEEAESVRRADCRARILAASDPDGAPEAGPDGETLEQVEIRPRFAALATLEKALAPLHRKVGYLDGSTTLNVTAVPDGNLLVVCETPERLTRIRNLVARIDRPRPQVTLVASLLRVAGEKGKGEKLPEELVRHLRQLVPAPEYESLSTGMLRCSVQTGQQCNLNMTLANGGSWKLSFFPDAYDAQTGEIALSHCEFSLQLPATPGQPSMTQSFDTSLTIKSGEFVVLGGVGEVPTFVVLRAEPIKMAQ